MFSAILSYYFCTSDVVVICRAQRFFFYSKISSPNLVNRIPSFAIRYTVLNYIFSCLRSSAFVRFICLLAAAWIVWGLLGCDLLMNTSLQCKWRWELLCLTSDSRLKCEFPVTNSIGPAKSALTSLQYLHTVASLSCTYCSHEKACSYSFWNLYCLPVTESFCFLPTTTSTSCSSSSCSFYCFLKLPSSASFEADLLKKFDGSNHHHNTSRQKCH